MSKELRIYFIPVITDVSVAEDGENFEKIIPGKMHQEEDDYDCTVSVTPGVSRIRFTAVPDGVEHYFWTYSDDNGSEEKIIGDGSGMCVCEIAVPVNLPDGVTVYVEEGHKDVDFGFDHRDLYFKCESDAIPVKKEWFEILKAG